MVLLQNIISGLKALFRKEQLDQDLNEELRSYLDAAVERKVRDGMSCEEATRAARKEIGSMETVKHQVRSIGWESLAESLWQDIRYSLRMLAKSPGFTMVAVLSLALGIGANTAIFTLINQLMLKSLPVRDPQYLVSFGDASTSGAWIGVGPGPLDIFSYEFYKRLEQKPEVFDGICAFGSGITMVSIRSGAHGNEKAAQAYGHLVSGNFFRVLGAEPMLGRTILPRDADAPGRNPVAVLSYRYWQQELAADPAVIGRSLVINGTIFTVVGVMPQNFYGAVLDEVSPDMWLPITMQQEVMLKPSLLGPHGLYWLHLMGRRQPSTSVKQARAWVTTQLQQYIGESEGPNLAPKRKEEIRKIYVDLLPGSGGVSSLRNTYRDQLLTLMGVVVLVLLIACANLANFLLAKAAAREREISTRLALGSSRKRLLFQILTEALLLSMIGGVLGLGVAYAATSALIKFVGDASAHTALKAQPDLQVLAFTFGASLLTGLLFGLAPALRVSRMSVTPALKANTRTAASSGGESGRMFPKMLVVGQVMLSLVLLSGAGIFLRTLHNLENQDLGFSRHSLLLVNFNPKLAGYKPEQLNGLYDRILDRLHALPGVKDVAISGHAPITGNKWASDIAIPGYAAAPDEDLMTSLGRVSTGYFAANGISLLRGRAIDARDTATSPQVAVVNRIFADHFFPHGDAIGRHIIVNEPDLKGEWEIVGVAREGKYHGPRDTPERMVYLPLRQVGGDSAYPYWIELQTTGDSTGIEGEIRAAMAEIDSNLPLLEFRTIDQQVEGRMEQEKMISQLSGIFALLALSLACIGLYGVMTYNVIRRTNEIGIRLALGAQMTRVLGMVLQESMLLFGLGILLGLPVTLIATNLVKSQLFGMKPSDPLTLLAAILIIAVVTLGAAYLPARRAAKVDPMVALRYE